MVTACLVTVTVVKLSIYKKQYEFVKLQAVFTDSVDVSATTAVFFRTISIWH